MPYTPLTEEQRYQISGRRKAGDGPSRIGQEVGRHKSTVSRELRRNAGARGG